MQDERRIVILGTLGSGKSSTGNTLLNRRPEETFETGISHPTTKSCEKKVSSIRHGKTLSVIDTPAINYPEKSFFDIGLDLLNFLDLVPASGPHVFVFIIPFGRITPEIYNSFSLVTKVLGNVFNEHSIIVFTNVNDPQPVFDNKISKYKADNQEFKYLLNTCHDRYVAFDNKHPENNDQMERFLSLVENVSNEGKRSVNISNFQNAKSILEELRKEHASRRSREYQENMFNTRLNENREGKENKDMCTII